MLKIWLSGLAFAGLLALPAKGAEVPVYLDGMWEGVLSAHTDNRDDDVPVRLHIHQGTVNVSFNRKGTWEEVKPGKFKLEQNNFNAIISTIDFALSDCWEEAMVFAVGLTTSNQLMARYSRLVTNIRCINPSATTFSHGADGTLKLLGGTATAPTP